MAGTIDQLNFEVILKDADFRTQIEKDIELADKLNTHLSDALNFRKRIQTVPLEIYRKEMEKIEKASRRASSAQGDFNRRVDAVNARLNSSSRLLRNISILTGGAFSVIGLRRFLSTLIDITGQFEVQKMALRNMLQDVDGADKIFEDLYNFSSKSTYRFSELAKYAKQLAAFNISQDSLLETTKMLGDVASGVGVSMDRLILAYGHVKSSGFLRGIQLRSFSQNGVPILEELSKMLTEIEGKAVSLGDVFDKMTKREISFEMVEEAFKRMTSEGGKFYQMQEVLAKTLAGQINILKGKWENLMYAMGESQEGFLKGAVATLTKVVSNMESFGAAVREIIAVLGAYRVAAIVTTAVTEGLATAINASLVGRAFKGILSFAAKNPIALVAAGIALVTIEIIKAKNALSDTEKITKALDTETKKYSSSLANEERELDLLVGRLRNAKEGTAEYAAAKAALEKRFDPYIQQLRNEGVAVNDLTNLYSGLVSKIREAQREKYLERAQTAIIDAWGTARDNIEKLTGQLIKEMGTSMGRQLSGTEEGAIRHYIETGEKNAIFKTLSDVLNERRTIQVGGSISTGPELTVEVESYMTRLRRLMNQESEAADAYATAMQDAAERFGQARKDITGDTPEGNENVIRINSVIEGIKKIDTELSSLRSKAKSTGGITETEQKRIESLIEDREEQTKLYKSIMGTDYDKQVKSTVTAENKVTKERISNIKSEISVLEKYRDAREKLEPFFGYETDSQLSKIFGNANDYATLDAQIKGLCDDLRELGEDGVEAADQIETRLGLDRTSSIIKAQKALQKWQTTLRSWTKDWGGGDFHGIEYDIDKVIREYNNEDEDITNDYIDSLNEIMEAHWGDVAAIEAEIEALDKLVAARRAANSISSQEKLNDLASKYVKESTSGLNLSDWGDKSIGQIRDLYRTLKELADGEIVLDQTTRNRLESAGLKIDDFANLARDSFRKLSDEAQQELLKKLGGTLKEVISDLGAVVDAMAEVADMNGKGGVVAFADAMREMLPMVESTIGRLAQGDYIGAVVGWFAQIATGFFRAKQEALQFEATIRSAQESARRSGFSDMLGSGVDSIFGTNGMAKVGNVVSVIEKLKASMSSRSMMDSFSVKRGFWEWFVGQGGLSQFRYMQFSLEELANSVGRDLYDSYGNLNAETMQAILDTYEGLGQAEREWIQEAIDDSEAYAEAMEQLDDVMESLFGNIASQAADKIVESWAEAGDAALDYVDILDDVARSYAKMITQSMLIESVFTPDFKDRLMGFFKAGDTENAMALILGGMEQMQAMAPVIADALEPLRPYIQQGGSSADTLKEGINKELVEGNSSLIASYINAMRADLSVIRGLQTTGWQDIRFVRDSVPTFLDYAAQVAANTYDNAQATQAILSRLQSVITPSTTGGSAVRTTK